MNSDSITQLTQKVLKNSTDRGWDADQRSLAISITLEAAELLEHFQWEDYAEHADNSQIASEMADVFI